MKIYINNVLQKTEILPANIPTKDETLETFSFALISNTNPLPLSPMQKVRVDFNDDGEDLGFFYIVSDSVETFSLNPLKYKHTISCVQNTRKLSKHLVRNSVFTQPAYLNKSSFNAEGMRGYSKGQHGAGQEPPPEGHQAWYDAGNVDRNSKSEKLSLTIHEKIKNATFKLSFQYITFEDDGRKVYAYDHTTSEILARTPKYESVSFYNKFVLQYVDGNGVTQQQDLVPSDFGLTEFRLNESYPLPIIKELADSGCNNFEIIFDTDNLLDTVFNEDEGNYGFIIDWFCQVEIVAETYYWTCYDILDFLIKRQRKQTELRPDDAPLFELPRSGELYNLLKNTIAPNFTFTQLTMYECVAEVFRVFDAIFTMDENGVLGIEYFNDLDAQYIPAKNAKFSGRTLAIGEDKYTNGIVAHYQDARTFESFPSSDGAFAHLRSAEFGVPEKQDHNFIVPHRIDGVIKCEILLDGFGGYNDVTFYNTMVVDITRYVVERNVWSTLNTGAVSDSDKENRIVKQANSLFYDRGDNKVQFAFEQKTSWGINTYSIYILMNCAIARLFGQVGNQYFFVGSDTYRGKWYNIKARLTYITSVDGKTEVHSVTNKYDGETLIDQSNGAVDLNKMGLNMLGLSLKIGNPTLNATHRITKWNDRIKTGQLYEYQGRLWVANVVNYTFFKGCLQGKISFVQNFNQLALRTQLLREKRMTNISQDLIQKSEEILTDFIYYSSDDIDTSGSVIYFKRSRWKEFLRKSFDVIGPYPKIGDCFVYDPDSHPVISGQEMLKFNAGIFIPMVTYGAGNTVNFEISFEHPMNAGNRTIYGTNWAGTNYYTTHVVYTDDYGFKDTISIKTPTVEISYTENFPFEFIYSDLAPDNAGEGYFDIRDFKIYKQPNETFALNYQIAFLPIPGRENIDFIGNEFINTNCFVKRFVEEKRKLYVCIMEEKSSVLDVKAVPQIAKKEITNVGGSSVVSNPNRQSIAFTFASSFSQEQINAAKSWAIIDENDNILFASNNLTISSNYVHIYFLSKQTRLI